MLRLFSRRRQGLKIWEIFFIDLNKVDLIGWERIKSIEVIDYLVQRIYAGDEFPPVPVSQVDDTTFHLYSYLAIRKNELVDGGHHRAVAHYIAGKPLKVVLYSRRKRIEEFVEYRTPQRVVLTNIRDIVLVNAPGSFGSLKAEDPNYRKEFEPNRPLPHFGLCNL